MYVGGWVYILRSTVSLGFSVQHDERVTLGPTFFCLLDPLMHTQILQELHNNFHNLPCACLLPRPDDVGGCFLLTGATSVHVTITDNYRPHLVYVDQHLIQG